MNGYSRAEQIAMGLRGVSERCGISHSGCDESPIFIFSTSRGSGADELAKAFARSFVLATDTFFPPGVVDSLARQLIAAGLGPHGGAACARDGRSRDFGARAVDGIIKAQVRYFRDIGTSTARQNSSERWGFVQYDLAAEYALYLRFLFPAAQCVFLRRGPADCYRSFLAQQAMPLEHHEALAASFQKHCMELASGFERWHQEVNGLLVDYERLGAAADDIQSFLGIAISDDMRTLWRSTLVPSELATEAVATVGSGLPARPEDRDAGGALRSELAQRSSFWLSPTVDVGSCAVLVPISRYIEPECDESLRALERRGYVVRRLYGCPAIDAARNILATRALDEGFKETLWVDADVGFDPEAVERLRERDLPVICGICAKKGIREVAAGLLPGTAELIFGEGGGLIELLYAGTGFLHVRREVYEAIRDKLSLPMCNAWSDRRALPFFMPMIEQWGDQFTYLSEDYGFCRRARQCGFKIYADTSIRLWHIGSYRYGYEDASAEIARVKTHHYRPPGA